MKVMFINHDANEKGGASKSLVNLVCNLHERYEIDPIIVLPKKGGLSDLFRKEGFDVIITRFYWWQVPKRFSFLKRNVIRILRVMNVYSILKLKTTCKKEKIELIHSNSSVIDIGMKLSNFTSIPHVWHFREFGDLDLKLEYLFGKAESLVRINKSQSAIITISKALREYYNDLTNVTVCYNGVGQENLYLKKNETAKRKVNIIVTGRYSLEKGQMDVLHVAKRLIDNGILGFEINMYGDSLEKGFLDDLKKYVENNGIGNYVKINGFSSNIHEVRKNADIEIVSSKAEAFGRVIIEAMKSSCAVIASDTGACPELVDDGKTGLLFKYGDEDDLYEKINLLLKNKDMLKNMMTSAYFATKDSYTVESNAYSIYQVYREVIK